MKERFAMRDTGNVNDEKNNGSANNIDADDNSGKEKSFLYNILYILIILLILSIGIVSVILGDKYFSEKWYVNTFFNDVDVSSQSLQETITQMKNKIADYSLTVKTKDNRSFTISGADINISSDIEQFVNDEFIKQHKKNYLTSLFGKDEINVNVNISYSDEKLLAIINELDIFKTNIIEPENAKIIFNEEKQCAEIQPEVYGTKINKETLIKALKKSIEEQKTELILDKNEEFPDIYYQPALKADSKEANDLLYDYNKYILHWINWNIAENKVVTLTPKDIMDCIAYDDKNFTADIDENKVSEWVEKTCLEFKTVGKTRKFITYSGKEIDITGGDYGWQMDYNQMLKLTLDAIKNINNKNIEEYTSSFSEDAKKSLTADIEPVYKRKGFVMNFDNMTDDWDHKNYSEVSISEQMVYVFKNGEMVFSAPCITGKPTSKRTTSLGTFYLKEKSRNKVLVGEDYRTPVSYWCRITWTGIGYHDATWQNWDAWDKNKYKSVGSHGCINLSMSSVENIYNLVEINDPVFIYN